MTTRMLRAAALALAFSALTLSGGRNPAVAAEFTARPGKEMKVVFVSRAAMEKFEGRTNQLAGMISVDPDAMGDSATVRFEVDMASLDTGIKMRNTHMRENHLHTDKFPQAVFEGASIPGRAAAALAPGTPTALNVEGTFTLHGVSRRMKLAVVVTYRPTPAPARLEFKTEFPVALADHAIDRPQVLFLTLADVQTVKVSGVAVEDPAAPAPPAEVP
jgi:polyisoprenoid-binding protein YceI